MILKTAWCRWFGHALHSKEPGRWFMCAAKRCARCGAAFAGTVHPLPPAPPSDSTSTRKSDMCIEKKFNQQGLALMGKVGIKLRAEIAPLMAAATKVLTDTIEREVAKLGVIQITGRTNYAACSRALGLDLLTKPELLEQTANACRSPAGSGSRAV